ncbi:MAG: nicotinamide mononucleotide deamidase-related protein [Candidatus Bathyarchaeia archaeon]
MSTKMEILCIGNELLIGKTLNTNATWIAKRATSLGITVKRITTVEDDTDEIAAATVESISRKPQFIITTGGLGPTFDDKTLEGIAKALNLKLKVDESALKMVAEKYESYAKKAGTSEVEMTPPRVKMATIPEGAKPLNNPVGTAPAVILEVNGSTLVALPGVPSEMEAIFEESVVPLLKRKAANATFFETSIFVERIMESALAPLIDQTMKENPKVYIKSHPKGEENMPRIELHFSTTASDPEIAKNIMGKAIVQLSELIENAGGKVKVQKPQRLQE